MKGASGFSTGAFPLLAGGGAVGFLVGFVQQHGDSLGTSGTSKWRTSLFPLRPSKARLERKKSDLAEHGWKQKRNFQA